MSVLAELSSTARQILIKFPYYGMFLATLNKAVDTTGRIVPTAGVGRNGIGMQIWINQDFWKDLIAEDRRGVILHELLHICFFHPTMALSFRDKALFNIAADVEINQYVLPHTGFTLPEGCLTMVSMGLDPSTDANKGTRYYYQKLKKKHEADKSTPEFKEVYEKMTQGVPVICSHDLWKQFADLPDAVVESIKGQIESQMTKTYEECSTNRGTLPQHLRELLEELIKPKRSSFDWKGAVRRFTGGFSREIYTKKVRRKENKRFPDLPGLKIKQKKRLLCAVDTSGSVSHDLFIEFMREVDQIRKAGVNITVVECDAYVDPEKGVYEFKGLSQIQHRSVTGGGGTSFDPPIEYLNEKSNEFSAMIYLTDGYAPCPVTLSRKPIMWVISRGGKAPKVCRDEGFPGMIIRIPEEIT